MTDKNMLKQTLSRTQGKKQQQTNKQSRTRI